MPKTIEHSFDDPDGPVNSGDWKILSPTEAEQLRRALERRSAAAQNQQPRADEPEEPSHPTPSPEEQQDEPEQHEQVQTHLLFGMSPPGQQRPDQPPSGRPPDDRVERLRERLRELRQRRLQQAQPDQPHSSSEPQP